MRILNFIKQNGNITNLENERRKLFINLFAYICIIVLLIFDIKGFIDKRIGYSVFLSGGIILVIIALLILKISKKIKLITHTLIFILFVFEFILFTIIGKGVSGLFWCTLFPPITILITNCKKGTIYSIAFILILSATFITKPAFMITAYSNEIFLRFFFLYFIILVLINIFEYSRQSAFTAYIKVANDLKEKELRLRSIIENQDEGFIITDFNENFTFTNPAASKIFGMKNEQLTGKNLKQFTSKKEFEKITKQTLLRKKGQKSTYELTIILPNNIKKCLMINSIPEFDKNNCITGTIASIQDITAHKNSEQAMRESEMNFKTLVANSFDGILINDKDANYLYANKRAAEIAGYKIEELLKLNVKDLTPTEKINAVSSRIHHRISGKKTIEYFEATLKKKDGSLVPIEITAAFTIWEGVPAELISMRDISDRKKAEQAIKESEQRFSNLFNQSPLATIIVDAQGKIVQFNESAYKILGYTKEEYTNKNIMQIDANFDIATTQKRLAELMKKGVISFETQLRTKSGNLRDVSTSQKTIIIHGKPYLQSIAIDITEQKLSKISELKNKEKFRFLSQTTPILFSFNSENEIIDFVGEKLKTLIPEVIISTHKINTENNTIKILNIYSNNKLLLSRSHHFFGNGIIGREFKIALNLNETYPQSKLKEYEGGLSYLLEGSFTDEAINTIHKKIGLNRAYGIGIYTDNHINIGIHLLSLNSFVIENKQFIEIFIQQATTAIQQMLNLKKIKKAQKEAEKANRLKSEFLASMSHEIRTPLNAVLGFAEILNNKLAEKADLNIYIDGIINGGKNLLSLINDILDLSKIEAGYLKINTEPINLKRLIEEVITIFFAKIQTKKIQLVLNFDKHFATYFMFDQTRMRQILFNLIGNAIKFTETGTISVSAKVIKKISNKNKIDLVLEIEDTGIGIPTHQIDCIFESFTQIKGQSSKYEGTGLGLPITKRLVEAMNAKISVKSEVGKGSVFSIYFKDVIIPDIENASEIEIIPSEINNIKFNNPKILLADDIKSNRDTIKHHLEKCNCKVFEVENGKLAIDFLASNTIDLILIDIQMPIINGYKTTKLIKQQEKLKTIPIIAFTDNIRKSQIEKHKRLFDDYLEKPILMKDIIKSLMRFLQYTETKSTKNTQKENQKYIKELTIHIKNNKKLSTIFIDHIKKEILPLYEDVKDIMDMDRCKKFATKLQEKGNEFNIPTFTKFSINFMFLSENFELSEIQNQLIEFGGMIEIIMNHKP